MEEQQHISTAADVRKDAESRQFEPSEIVHLPSGLTVRLQRPRPVWFILNRGQLPQSGVQPPSEEEKDKLKEAAKSLSDDELIVRSQFIAKLISAVVVEPKISLNPQSDDEIHPGMFSETDQGFLFAYAVGGGATAEEQSGLEAFPEQRDDLGRVTGGGPIQVPPKPDSERDDA